jgi:MFS family permease
MSQPARTTAEWANACVNDQSQDLTLGAISTAVGIGASLSQVTAGSLVHRFGYTAGFLFLGAIAAAALAILCFLMPETGKQHDASEKP